MTRLIAPGINTDLFFINCLYAYSATSSAGIEVLGKSVPSRAKKLVLVAPGHSVQTCTL